ncbi:hypothetical protein WMY93_020530 [Mugilogobius chulae]|uniref:SAP domain-containing protein n=1 Tax=Mugilogobius chulae TaxID=88201 RepID=A0AAW0N999_9GOBI
MLLFLSVSDIEEVSPNFKGEVNADEFWKSVDLDMISRGLVTSCATNPFSVMPNYEYWAPWIGKCTRKSSVVLNTEFEKISPGSASTSAELCLTEDRLVDELMKQKVSTVRKLCKSCNLDCSGSRMDLILRLREEMKSRHTYDKVFQKIWGASGGWSLITCPHGIVYSLKFNLRAESPRDFADMLLAWKHLPNICVYDFARGLATHANLRTPNTIPFKPFEGRLAPSTPENISAAQPKTRLVSPDPHGHPVTGSADHFLLYDKFHEANTKSPQEVLRRIDIVPELQTSLNSQVAEQLFSCLRKNIFFLNNMAPSTHIFFMRNIIHHQNNNRNEKYLKKQLERGQKSHTIGNISLNNLGQAVFAHFLCPTLAQLQSLYLRNSTDDTEGYLKKWCESMYHYSKIDPCRACWAQQRHSAQVTLLNYVLDEEGPVNELIVRTTKTALTRSDFQSLGLQQHWMESNIGNDCFDLIQKIAEVKGKNIFVVDFYVVPTWREPSLCNPLSALPSDALLKDAIVVPVWKPGHFMLCGFPRQPFGGDCGVFILMYALYTIFNAPFDFTIKDMPTLRKWWCYLLLETFELGGYGKLFAHWTEEASAKLRGEVDPVFRLKKRKREAAENQTEAEEETADPGLGVAEERLEVKVIQDCRKAVTWAQQNLHLFKHKVCLTSILQWEESEVAEACLSFVKFREGLQLDEDEHEAVLEPFKFIFKCVEDMWTFCEEVVDMQGLMLKLYFRSSTSGPHGGGSSSWRSAARHSWSTDQSTQTRAHRPELTDQSKDQSSQTRAKTRAHRPELTDQSSQTRTQTRAHRPEQRPEHRPDHRPELTDQSKDQSSQTRANRPELTDQSKDQSSQTRANRPELTDQSKDQSSQTRAHRPELTDQI